MSTSHSGSRICGTSSSLTVTSVCSLLLIKAVKGLSSSSRPFQVSACVGSTSDDTLLCWLRAGAFRVLWSPSSNSHVLLAKAQGWGAC